MTLVPFGPLTWDSSEFQLMIFFINRMERYPGLTTLLRQFLHHFSVYSLLILFFFIQLQVCGCAQPLSKFSGQNYNVNEGLLESHVLDMVEDDQGFLWISTAAGLQRFDGVDFKLIPEQKGTSGKGLPETGYIHFLKLRDGTIWMSYSNGISCYSSKTDKFQTVFQYYIPLSKQLQDQNSSFWNNPVIPVAEWQGIVWCWWFEKRSLIGISEVTHKVVDSIPIPPIILAKGNGIDINNTQQYGTKILLNFSTRRICEVGITNEHKIRIINFPSNYGDFHSYSPLDSNHLLIASSNGLYKGDFRDGTVRFLSHYPGQIRADQINYQTLCNFHDSEFFTSVNNEIYLVNGENGHFLQHVVNLQNESFGQTGYINRLMLDHFHHLWALSLTEGITKINLNDLGIKYYGTQDNKNNFIRSIYVDKKADLIIAGTLYGGVMLYDTLQRLIKQINFPSGMGQVLVSSILKIRPYQYLLFTTSKYSSYILDGRRFTLSPSPPYLQKLIKPSFVTYYSNVQVLNDTTALFNSLQKVLLIHYGNGKIVVKSIFKDRFSTCGIMDRKGQLWLGCNGIYLLVKGKHFNKINVFQLHENSVSKCLYQDKAGNIWLGTENGLYELDDSKGTIRKTYNKNEGMADNCIYSLLQDDEGNIWCGTNKGLSCLKKDGKIVNIYASDGLQGNEFNNNSCAKANDGELFFGGVNGINSFFPNSVLRLNDQPLPIITNIKVMDEDWDGDTSAWDLHQITVPYSQDVLSFTFSTMGRYRQDIYTYQYRMVGIDKNWVNSGNYGYARYVLPPGYYTFQYAASHSSKDGFSEFKQIGIRITPPYWRKGWFICLSILFMAGLLGLLMYSYFKWKYNRQLRKLEIERTVQLERERISRDLHDNIGAYTTALIASVDHLQEFSDRPSTAQKLQHVSDNAHGILGFLQETIWVLNNEFINMTDFTDRFKLYATKMGRHYPGVELKFRDEIQKDSKLSPTEALQVFRILQEALQNAFKHADSSRILITVVSGDTRYFSIQDNGRGFNTGAATAGNGLKNMQFRAKEAGYLLNIISLEQGSEITLLKEK